MAKSAYEGQNYTDAEDVCLNLLERFPDSANRPQAMLLMGLSRKALGNMAGAEAVLVQLIDAHPDRPEAMDARIELLGVQLDQGRYREVVQTASGMLDQAVTNGYRLRVYLALGDAQNALGAAADAFDAYLRALDKASGEQIVVVRERMAAVSTLLNGEEIEQMLSQPMDPWAQGLLTFQIGIVRAGEGHYDEAVWYFNRYVEGFPYHDNVTVAYELMDQLTEAISFERYALGCLLPLSGPYRVFGQRALDGIELALADIGALEPDLPIRLIVKDSGSDPQRAFAAMEAFTDLKVASVIGPIATAESAAGVAQEAGIPIMTLTQKEDITGVGRYVFRNFLTPRMQAAAIADFAVNRAGMKRFGIFYPEEAYGRAFMGVFWEELIRMGGSVVGVESFKSDQTDFEEPLNRLVGRHYRVPAHLASRDIPLTLLGQTGLQSLRDRADAEAEEALSDSRRSRSLQKVRGTLLGSEEDPMMPTVDFEALFIPDAPGKVGLIVPQLAYQDILGVTFLGTNLWQSDKLIEMSGEFLDGAVFPSGFYLESRRGSVQQFVQRFESVYGRQPEFIEAIAYDSARLMIAAVLSPDAWLRSGIRHRLTSMDGFEGVTGFTRFSSDGEAQKSPFLLQIQGDGFIEIDMSDPTIGARKAPPVPPPPPVWRGVGAP
jgi:ABC-type branched-subunit amino acid transport system substrate-binding protein/predicted negative regulator of RcsB-dependent stress response